MLCYTIKITNSNTETKHKQLHVDTKTFDHVNASYILLWELFFEENAGFGNLFLKIRASLKNPKYKLYPLYSTMHANHMYYMPHPQQ